MDGTPTPYAATHRSPGSGAELTGTMGDGEFSRVMERFASAFADYRDRLPLVRRAYTRTRLAVCDDYEVVAMNWAPQSVSPIHDHGTSRCWVLMLEGRLDVQNYSCDAADVGAAFVPLRETERLDLRTGDADDRLNPTELHRVHNPSDAHSAFSLQIYARPLMTFSIVDTPSMRRRAVTAVCDLDLSGVILSASAIQPMSS